MVFISGGEKDSGGETKISPPEQYLGWESFPPQKKFSPPENIFYKNLPKYNRIYVLIIFYVLNTYNSGTEH